MYSGQSNSSNMRSIQTHEGPERRVSGLARHYLTHAVGLRGLSNSCNKK